MAREREKTTEQILDTIIAIREDKSKINENDEFIVNKQNCKSIGLFNYKVKETGKTKAGYIFFINEIHNGKEVNIIYDETGNSIAWQREENGMDLEIDPNLELDKKSLKRQIDMGIERTKTSNNSGSGSSKGGEGRDLPKEENKEKEEKQEQKENNKTNETPEIQKSKELKNLKYEINITRTPKIKLDTIINSYYLWEILDIEDKLKDRLPKDLNIKSFRTGYLTVIDSKELTQKDGKERNSEDTLLIVTRNEDIIELDEEIVKPRNLGPAQEKLKTEKNRLRYVDGKEAEKPDTTIDTTRTSLFQIPNVHEKYNVDENWYIGIDKSREWVDEGKTPVSGNKKEISFVQQSRDVSYYEREVINPNDTLEYKLKPINEREKTENLKEEEKQKDELANKDAFETEKVRNNHTEELVLKCFEKYPKLGEIYNRTDITKKVEKYHEEYGMSDEEILNQIGEDLNVAERTEQAPRGTSRRI